MGKLYVSVLTSNVAVRFLWALSRRKRPTRGALLRHKGEGSVLGRPEVDPLLLLAYPVKVLPIEVPPREPIPPSFAFPTACAACQLSLKSAAFNAPMPRFNPRARLSSGTDGPYGLDTPC